MFWYRAAVAFTFGPLVLLLIYLGGWPYFLPFAGLLTLGIIEYSQLVGRLGLLAPLWLIVPPSLAYWLLSPLVQTELFGQAVLASDPTAIVTLVSLLVTLLYALWLYEHRPQANAFGAWLAAILGVLLLGWLGSHFFMLRGVPSNAAQWTALAMLSTWFADSGGYVFGKTLGRNKLSPRASPNKTIEGYFGGIFAGTAAAALIALVLRLPVAAALPLGLLITTIGPAGDLGISLLKRTVGVKDSGQFLPGHGGALDRIDSLVWAVAIAFYFVTYLVPGPA